MRKELKELRQKSISELEKQISQERHNLTKLLLGKKVNPAKDTNEVPKKRKNLAAALTVLGELREIEMLKKEEK